MNVYVKCKDCKHFTPHTSGVCLFNDEGYCLFGWNINVIIKEDDEDSEVESKGIGSLF